MPKEKFANKVECILSRVYVYTQMHVKKSHFKDKHFKTTRNRKL